MGFIYKISNDFNNKAYIGQTSRTIQIRFKEHISKPNNTHIDNSIKKHGATHFIVEEIEQIANNDLLDEREIYWINYFDTYHNGYNETPGGGGRQFSECQKQAIYSLWDQGKGIKEICDILDFSRAGVRKTLQLYHNYSKEESHQRNIKQHFKKISIYDIENNFLYNEDSIINFCNKNSITTGAVVNAIKNHHNILNKFRIIYEGDSLDELEKFPAGKRYINQYSLDGKLINKYKSLTEAGKAIKGDRHQISRVLDDGKSYYKDCFWRYGDLI